MFPFLNAALPDTTLLPLFLSLHRQCPAWAGPPYTMTGGVRVLDYYQQSKFYL